MIIGIYCLIAFIGISQPAMPETDLNLVPDDSAGPQNAGRPLPPQSRRWPFRMKGYPSVGILP